jgi:hypothetical protein
MTVFCFSNDFWKNFFFDNAIMTVNMCLKEGLKEGLKNGMTQSSLPRSGKHKQTPTAKEKSRQRFFCEPIFPSKNRVSDFTQFSVGSSAAGTVSCCGTRL